MRLTIEKSWDLDECPVPPTSTKPANDEMVILRPTRKLRSLLPVAAVSAQSDTALGDWYVNRIVFERQPLLLLVSSKSLLAVVLPARDVRGLPDRLKAVVASRLQRLGLESAVVEAELRAMHPVIVASTADRSVLGIMVDFAKCARYYLGKDRTELGFVDLEDYLAETPCYAGSADRVVFPKSKAPNLLREKWLAKRSQQPTSGDEPVVQ